MKCVDIENLDQLPGRRIQSSDTFCFRCHSALACFNQCCRNLNLFLYPYDVIRLKRRLGISADQFLERHVDIVLRSSNFFPEVLLRMADNPAKTCPFLTESGCAVYPDRPGTCRTFPLEQGLLLADQSEKTGPVYIYRPPDFCLGQHEKKVWTPRSWVQDQDAVFYNRLTGSWAEVKGLFQSDPWGLEGPEGRKARMAFMATYNMDAFRDFVFKSSFLKRYRVSSGDLKKIKKDDVELLRLGIAWVKLFLWGLKSQLLRLR